MPSVKNTLFVYEVSISLEANNSRVSKQTQFREAKPGKQKRFIQQWRHYYFGSVINFKQDLS
jgi:hypothetical protein